MMIYIAFFAGAMMGALVIAFLIGARQINREIEQWEKRHL